MVGKIYFLVALFLLEFLILNGQDASVVPIHQYKFSKEIIQEKEAGTMKNHSAAQYFSYIGRYADALQIPNEIDLEWGFDTLRAEDRAYMNELIAMDAVDAILAKAEENQIIIINEAHHKPRHRLFTYRLLEGLYKRGYRYFGLEALSNCAYFPAPYCDSLLNERGYALNSPLSGTYVMDPKMALLIRKGIQTGFELFAYEKFGQDRELWQARYVAKVLEKDPTAKIVLHVGWYHLLEEENQGRRWMADYLQELTGIDPLTIYQDLLIERYCILESPFFTALPDYDVPKVFVNQNGELYNGFSGFKKFDALVYHPRTKYIRNRPDWWVHFGENQIVEFNQEKITIPYPVLIKAYDPKETNATPLDITEIRFAGDQTALVLPPGKYRIVIESANGEQQEVDLEVAKNRK